MGCPLLSCPFWILVSGSLTKTRDTKQNPLRTTWFMQILLQKSWSINCNKRIITYILHTGLCDLSTSQRENQHSPAHHAGWMVYLQGKHFLFYFCPIGKLFTVFSYVLTIDMYLNTWYPPDASPTYIVNNYILGLLIYDTYQLSSCIGSYLGIAN